MGILDFLPLVGDATSLVGSILGAKNVKDTNETNLQIAQMNNEFNERMFERQMDYNTFMWNQTNSYNSASAQRQRLESAGLNAALMMSGNNAGVASSAGNVTPPTATPVTMQAFDPSPFTSQMASSFMKMGEMLQNQPLIDAQSAKAGAEASNIEIKNRYEARLQALMIGDLASTIKNKELQAGLLDLQKSLFHDTYSQQVKRSALENYQITSQITSNLASAAYTGVQMSLAKKELQYFDKQKLAELSAIAARIYADNMAAGLSYQQSLTEGKKRLLLDAQRTGLKISNETAEKMMTYTISKADYEAQQAYWEAVKTANSSHPDDLFQLLQSEFANSVNGFRDYINDFTRKWRDKYPDRGSHHGAESTW